MENKPVVTSKQREEGRGKLQSHEGECSNRGAEVKVERFPHKGSVPTSTHQPERLVCSPSGRVGAGS